MSQANTGLNWHIDKPPYFPILSHEEREREGGGGYEEGENGGGGGL